MNRLTKSSTLAQMEMESHGKLKYIFFWLKKATNGSSFYALKKSILAGVLEMDSWNSF
ncbi:hypothetical protein [uncultured Flavobacterium sp.]|uniref:hypothetical protein n=1 Tax=uncultured Flavobacterium sp. TaxID=165435 RepID=UPI0025E4CFA0|nr:hypothetical protein [uncultured Flavobacterium sp.]